MSQGAPAPAHLAHYDVGDDVAHVAGSERAAGLGIEREHERADLAKVVLRHRKKALELVEVARGEHVEVPGHELDGAVAVRRRFGHRAQLQLEAFRDVACTDARGLEVLHVLQRDLQVLDLDVGHRGDGGRAKLLEVLLEVAVLVEVADDHRGDALVALGEADERQLRFEMLGERGLRGGELGEVVAVVVLAARGAGADVLVAEAVVLREGGLLLARVGAGDLLALTFLAKRLSRGDRHVGRRRRRFLGRKIGALEQRVLGEVTLQLLVQLDRGQLQQPDRLL